MTISEIESIPSSAGYRVYFKNVGKYQFKVLIEFREYTSKLIDGVKVPPRSFLSDITYRSGKLLKHDYMFNFYKFSNVNFTEL